MASAKESIIGHLQTAVAELKAAIAKTQSFGKLDANELAPALGQNDGHCAVEYLSVKQLAQRVPYSEQTIRNLMSAGEFKQGVHYYKRRRRIMFSWLKIEEWLRERRDADEAEQPFYPVHHARTRKAQ